MAYTIRNKKDLKCAYSWMRFIEAQFKENGVGHGVSEEYLKQLKRDIRAYNEKDKNIVDNGYFKYEARYAYSYGDDDNGYVELITFPLFFGTEELIKINSIEEADEFFREWFYIEPYYTYYDCTGRPFTSWYHVFKRRGTWFAYHRVNYDV